MVEQRYAQQAAGSRQQAAGSRQQATVPSAAMIRNTSREKYDAACYC